MHLIEVGVADTKSEVREGNEWGKKHNLKTDWQQYLWNLTLNQEPNLAFVAVLKKNKCVEIVKPWIQEVAPIYESVSSLKTIILFMTKIRMCILLTFFIQQIFYFN